MSKIQYVSASSITLYRNCPMKWYHRYILGVRGETSAAMMKGTQVHEELETFLLTGDFKNSSGPAAQIAAAGVEHLPTGDVAVELSLDDFPLAQALAVPFRGFIDVLSIQDGKPVHILDHKTTSNLKYALTPEELAQNTQLIIYAKHVLDNLQDKDSAILTHVYYTTKPPYKSKRVDVHVTRAEVDEAFEGIKSTVTSMLHDSEREQDSITRDTRFCRAYNSMCEHYATCFPSISNRVQESVMTEKKADILAFLRGEIKTVSRADVGSTDVGSADVGSVGSPSIDNAGATDVGSADVGSVSNMNCKTPKTSDKDANMVRLFVGVNDIKGNVRPLTEALAPLCKEICEAKNVEHISLIPYAAGWNLLAASIQKNGIPAGDWYVDPHSQYYTHLADELLMSCDSIFVRG